MESSAQRHRTFPTAGILAAIGGVLLIVSVFLTWYQAQLPTRALALNGVQLGVFTPELLVLPAFGLVIITGALLQSSRHGFRQSSLAPGVFALVLGVVAIGVALEAAIRFDAQALRLFGTGFYAGAAPGWFLGVAGGGFAFVAGAVELSRR